MIPSDTPIGTAVWFRAVSLPGFLWVEYKTRSAPWGLCGGAQVVSLEGRTGGCSTDQRFMRLENPSL